MLVIATTIGGALVFLRSIVTMEDVLFRRTSAGRRAFSPRCFWHYICVPFKVTSQECKSLWWLPGLRLKDRFQFWQMNWVICVGSGAAVGYLGQWVAHQIIDKLTRQR